MFPPARLGMKEAVESYFRYKGGPESWIVNRFLCPASRLEELSRYLSENSAAMPLGVIGTGGADLDRFETALESDAMSMSSFENRFGNKAPIEAYEVRLPEGAPVRTVAKDLEGFAKAEVYLELPWSDRQSDQLADLAASEWLGAKARTGGLEPSNFPTPEALAAFLKECQDLDLAFKLTAGLHQPARHFDRDVGVEAHGFLNILAALALNEAHDLSRAEMAQVLESEESHWTPNGFCWSELEVSFEEALPVRQLFVGFGSCSVDEPLEGLASLGFLEGARN
jgi:hypothetical protein